MPLCTRFPFDDETDDELSVHTPTKFIRDVDNVAIISDGAVSITLSDVSSLNSQDNKFTEYIEAPTDAASPPNMTLDTSSTTPRNIRYRHFIYKREVRNMVD